MPGAENGTSSEPIWTTPEYAFFAQNGSKFALSAISAARCNRTFFKKKLPPMKLFPPFFVLTGEDNDKLDVAEKEHDHDNYETPAPRGRPAKSFAGADC
jgi:hypothetical protein